MLPIHHYFQYLQHVYVKNAIICSSDSSYLLSLNSWLLVKGSTTAEAEVASLSYLSQITVSAPDYFCQMFLHASN